MKISAKQYAHSLYEAIEEKTEEEIKDIVERFANVLARNRHLGKAKEVINLFEKKWQESKGQLVASVISARELEEKAKNSVIDYLKKKTDAQEVVLGEKIDKGILGGFILKYDNKVVDGSLRNSLDELKRKMKA